MEFMNRETLNFRGRHWVSCDTTLVVPGEQAFRNNNDSLMGGGWDLGSWTVEKYYSLVQMSQFSLLHASAADSEGREK